MTIGELEKLTGLKRSTIRVYESMGLITANAAKTGNGYRRFDAKHVERLNAIRLAQTLGFSLKEIASLMDAWEGGRMTKKAKLAALGARLDQIEAKRAQLKALSHWMTALIGWVEAGETGEKPRLKGGAKG